MIKENVHIFLTTTKIDYKKFGQKFLRKCMCKTGRKNLNDINQNINNDYF